MLKWLNIKILIAVGITVLKIGSLWATHIVGGEMTYQRLGTNIYKVRLDLYIDCINGAADAIASDATANFGVFHGKNKTMLANYPVVVSRKGPVKIEKTNYNCISVAPNACVNHYWYETTLTLPPGTGGYYVSFQRCCRNGTISNIVNPGSTGADYWAFIPDASTLGVENSSAVFKELPPNYLCTNTPLGFDHSATDADGDSLAYDLITPYTGGSSSAPRPDNAGAGNLQAPPFSQIVWGSGYSASSPINGSPALNIDSKTGYLTVTPTRAGQFVVGIRVSEYRNGKFVAATIRDYQFNVQNCVIDVVASYFVPKIICGYKFQFTNQSSGATRYHWDFGVDSLKNDTANVLKPTYTFPHAGVYKVRLYAYKNKCVDSFMGYINVTEPQKPKLPEDSTICDYQSLKLKSNIKATSYQWNTGSTADSIVVKNPGTYWIKINVNGCFWSDTMVLSVDKDKIKSFGDTVYCTGAVFDRQLRSLLSNQKSILWSTKETTNNIQVTKSGSYRVIGITQNDCVSTDTVIISQYTPFQVTVNDTVVCPRLDATFNAKVTDPTAIIVWSTGATGNYMTTKQPNTYFVSVKIGLCIKSDTFTLTNYKDEYQLGKDIRFCQTIDTTLNIDFPNTSNVVWNYEIPGRTFHLTKPGKVVASWLNSKGCLESDSIMVMLYLNPKLDLGPDTSLCLSERPVLVAPPDMQSYIWNTGSKDEKITAVDSGLYWVKVKDWQGCSSLDSININKRKNLHPSDIYMPNAFTPNGDGRNDLYPDNHYKVKGGVYFVKLYNRWGEKLADFESPDQNWDGYIQGKLAPEGVYVYYLSWIGCDNFMRTRVGDFTLLR